MPLAESLCKLRGLGTLFTFFLFVFKTPEGLSKYMDAWDIVLTEDPTVQVLIAIVKGIVGNDIGCQK